MCYTALVHILFLLLASLFAPAPALAAQDFDPVPTLAVLYFDNSTGSDHLSWLPKGFADLVIRDMGRTGRIRVVDRGKIEEAQKTYRDNKSTPFTNKLIAQRIGKILGATHVMAGRFARRDTDLIVEIRIYDTEKSRQVGWRQIEGPSDDLMYLQKQVELKIVEILKIQMTDRELIDLMQIPTTNIKAIAYYSMGLAARDEGDRELARSYFQASIAADKYFKPAVESISAMAFVLSGKAILRAAVEETAVVGTAGIKSIADLLELTRTNAFDFSVGDPVTSPVEGDTLHTNVKLPLHFSVRPDFVNLWLYSIRRLGREPAEGGPSRKLTFARADLFDNPVVISLPEKLAEEWLVGWRALNMHLVFQGRDGNTLFETPRSPVLPLYIGNAEGEFEGMGAVFWQIDTAFEVERIPKQFFDDPLQVSLEIDR